MPLSKLWGPAAFIGLLAADEPAPAGGFRPGFGLNRYRKRAARQYHFAVLKKVTVFLRQIKCGWEERTHFRRASVAD